MIEVNGFRVKPDNFPDKTSQVWHLPDFIIKAATCVVTWWFEEEREVIDLLSLRKLTANAKWVLNIPYFPYARQDKVVDNNTTFNREVFCDIIDMLQCQLVTAVDIHSPIVTNNHNHSSAIRGAYSRFVNIEVAGFHNYVITDFHPSYLIFPDVSARRRYPYLDSYPYLAFDFEKARDQATGRLTSHQLVKDVALPPGRYLMIDDLCDGGATFISIADQIKAKAKGTYSIALAVTHGLFNKGKELLEKEGILLYYTNSLLRNADGYKVC